MTPQASHDAAIVELATSHRAMRLAYKQRDARIDNLLGEVAQLRRVVDELQAAMSQDMSLSAVAGRIFGEQVAVDLHARGVDGRRLEPFIDPLAPYGSPPHGSTPPCDGRQWA